MDNDRVSTYPSEPERKREVLLDAVASIAGELREHTERTEAARTLAPGTLRALRRSGLFKLKTPAELGGAEADPMVQMDVIEALTLIDPAAAWSMFISAAVTGMAAARASEAALEAMFGGPEFPCMAGTLRPAGTATRVDGGYRLSGKWSWGSGVRHADWITALAFADEPRGVLSLFVPIRDVEITDNWQVLGMKGTGSCDYAVNDAFVPDAFIASPTPLRGGPLYRLGMPGFVVNEHAAIALGLAQRVLNELTDLALRKRRGYGSGTTLADRPVVQREVSRARLRLGGARGVMKDVLARLLDAARDGTPGDALQAEARAAAVYVTDEALDVTSRLFRYAGGSSVFLDNVMQRCLRDLFTAQSHLVVSDVAYENHGAIVFGVTDKLSMA